MPKKAPGGSETVELLEYLFGPGERDEHTDPHLVAAWDPDLPCPARDPDRMSLADLALLLDAPVEALRGPRPEGHVWHVSVRNHAGHRTLPDAEWAEVVAAMVHAAGVAEHGDEQACQHATDHIHILATLARQDGRHPRLRGDILAMHTAARAFEARWGLTPMSPLDRTARRRPVTGEGRRRSAAASPRPRGSPCRAASVPRLPSRRAPSISSTGCATRACACASAAATTALWSGTQSRSLATARTVASDRCGSPV
ncbi:hypothetical protein ACFQ9Q_35675 [Streptomyces virginiae]|uniref:hypothetical protein n=1 Tax=Streptomyces TaxID=1883 RepID=UPI001370FBEE|nr:hypothetical protein [Streptomyces sp. SID1046]MYV74553.1 hypothetical protein [Streptomyces sp. SID1046]